MNNRDKNTHILLTNDDGIQSPGLWAAAGALAEVGFVTIAAPRDQASGTGRSMLITSDEEVRSNSLNISGQEWTVYSVGGTPAQAVVHGISEISPHPPQLVVSGINYGENVGSCITISGTVGAALEAAAMGVPAIAVSLELLTEGFFEYSPDVDFSTAAFFTAKFARLILEHGLPPDVDVLKVDVPHNATPQTPWRITRLSRHRYFVPVIEDNGTRPLGRINYKITADSPLVTPGTDIHTLIHEHMVSVTPLSLDMTSRVNLQELEDTFRSEG